MSGCQDMDVCKTFRQYEGTRNEDDQGGYNGSLGPAVQSIVSLTTSLRRQLVKSIVDYIVKYAIIFVGKM